uniref:SUEL-type lectin domain-containing protein n=1 Tax=Elaeophora elaphi TaxID=1147741 RepID=A0A0R3RIA6_9BILA
MVRPSFFGTDPCPNTSKYLQISYKCKPVSFDEETFCEGSTMQLSCKQNKRLVIYSAHYGRAVERRAMHCTPNIPISQDCMIDVLGQILYDCHAQAECTVLVNDEHFGKTGCGPEIMHKYLNLIFMCMNDEIFSEAALNGNFETMKKIIPNPPPKKLTNVEATLIVKDDERMLHIKDDPSLGYEAIQKTSPSQTNKNANTLPNSLLVNSYEESVEEDAYGVANSIKTTPPSDLSFNAFGFIHDVVLVGRVIRDKKEKVILCLLLSLLAGLTMLLIACAISGCCRRRMKRKSSMIESNEETVQATKATELNSLMGSTHSQSVFLDSSSRICFDLGDLSNNRESFLRFTQLTPPRLPQNIHGYS